MAPLEVNRKRQARGEARIQSLLDAAENVFGRVGYSKATTNEIAAQAQVSPATLYQFFKNKEEIANKLALAHVKAMETEHANFDLKAMAKLPMKKMVEGMFRPIFEFRERHPAFVAIFMDAPLSVETREAKMALSATLVDRVRQLLILRKPDLSNKDAEYQAEICMLVFRGFMTDICSAPSARKSMLLETMVDLVSMQFEKALE